MGWVLFSFHLQRFYSLVVSDERATLYLVRFPHVRRQWRIQHMGERLGIRYNKLRKKKET